MVSYLTFIFTFVQHILYRNITHSFIITLRTSEKMEKLKWGIGVNNAHFS